MINKEWWNPKTSETEAPVLKPTDTETEKEKRPVKLSPQLLLELLRQVLQPEEKPAPKDWYK